MEKNIKVLGLNYEKENYFNYLYETNNSFVGYVNKLTKEEKEILCAKLIWKRKKNNVKPKEKLVAKEKANELFIKYRNIIIDDVIDMKPTYFIMTDKMVKQCALYAVNEMLDFKNALYFNEGSLAQQYLLDIKKEIQKL